MNKTRPIYDIFDRAMSLIDKKADDYSEVTDHHSSFKYAEMVAAPFPERYKPYALLVGVKLARLSQLLQPDRDVQNEPVVDTFSDAMNYTGLMAERYELEIKKERIKGEEIYTVQAEPMAYPYCHICSREQTMCVCSKEIEPATIPLPPGFKW